LHSLLDVLDRAPISLVLHPNVTSLRTSSAPQQAFAVLAGARRFNGCVQRQQVVWLAISSMVSTLVRQSGQSVRISCNFSDETAPGADVLHSLDGSPTVWAPCFDISAPGWRPAWLIDCPQCLFQGFHNLPVISEALPMATACLCAPLARCHGHG
jgi:hypothetical protein